MWTPRTSSSEEILERALATCVEMVTDRGYLVQKACIDTDPVVVAVRGAEKLEVRFAEEAKVGVKAARQILAEMDDNGIQKVLLVSSEGPTPFTRKETASDRRLEFWTFSKLMYNVTRFDVVPRHTLVSESDTDALRKKYHISQPDEWPKISRMDPVRDYLWLVLEPVCIFLIVLLLF